MPSNMLGSSERCLTYWAFVVAGHWDKMNDLDGVDDGDEGVLEDERVYQRKDVRGVTDVLYSILYIPGYSVHDVT